MTTIAILKDQIADDLRNKLNISDDRLKKTLDALASVLAAQLKLTYLAIDDAKRNLYPDTADLEVNGGSLERLGRIYLNRDIRPATAAIYNASVIGEAGSVLRSGITFKSNVDSLNPGQLYVLDNEYTLTGSNDIIQIRSLGGGLDFSLDISNDLTITEPVIGVNKTVSVSSVDTDPLSAETVNEYRAAILNAIQLEPQGGAKSDYRIWANDAAGVRFVYPYIKDGDGGTVQIYVEASGANPVPTQPILDEVSEVINFDPDETRPLSERGRRPIQANLEVLPVQLVDIEVNITGLQVDTPAIRSAIETNLIAYLVNIRPFVDGSDLLRNKNDILYSARLQGVVTDVLEPDNFFNDFILLVDGVSQTSFIFSRENIPQLTNVNYL
tara:strand:+ start:12300 stop:13451 length:1152 start_codon:yes stop_codon:yes gene_type:complete